MSAGCPQSHTPSRRWPAEQAKTVDNTPLFGTPLTWATDPEEEYVLVPASSLRAVCGVVPHVATDVEGPCQALPPVTALTPLWLNRFFRDRAAPWRKADWQAGVASAARKRRLPPREEACEICSGFESDHHNQLFVCDHKSADGQPCLHGAHAKCLAQQREPVPSVRENWYCAEHRAQYS
jgi:hypothetical protein